MTGYKVFFERIPRPGKRCGRVTYRIELWEDGVTSRYVEVTDDDMSTSDFARLEFMRWAGEKGKFYPKSHFQHDLVGSWFALLEE